MAWIFGDGFDLYTAAADGASYWDANLGAVGAPGVGAAGRFTGSRSMTAAASLSTTPYYTKTSGSNDAVHR
jgi:hypothetical protein